MSSLEKALEFMQLMHNFQKVERVTPVPGTNRRENDAEHSYFLAMLAWYIIDHERLDLNLERVLTYALVHDLVETYAGDTFAYGPDKSSLDTKHAREQEAQKRLAIEFPDFPTLHQTITDYEGEIDQESRFVRALDKCIASLTVYLSRSTLWKDHDVTLASHSEYKKDKITAHPTVEQLYKELIVMLEKEESYFFKKSE